MTTKVVFYSVTGHARAVAEGAAATLRCPLHELTDRFSSRPAGWKRDSKRAVRTLDIGRLISAGVSFDRGDRVVAVFPFWNGPIVPAVTGFVRSVSFDGVEVFLVVTRRLSGGDILITQLEDDIVRQGGTVVDVLGIRTLWRSTRNLESLGRRIGKRIAGKPEGVPLSLQELLGDAIEGEVEARAMLLQLAEMTPNKRLKASFSSFAADEAAHAQMLQETYRLYSGTVYEPHRDAIAPLKPEQVSNYTALLEELVVVIDAERKAEAGYRAIAMRYWSQPDVVELATTLARLELRHLRGLGRIQGTLGRSRPKQ
ncbi:MAG: ferritin family protein [Candidatus Cryosericum sp.]